TLPSSCGFLRRAAAGGEKSQNHRNFGRSSNPTGKREAGWRSGRKITSNVVPLAAAPDKQHRRQRVI
ncbi:unnamed protein product, partial [Ectocarpus sp. 12 AP-2014]